jgi:signal transduction histidine kinase
MRTPLGAIIGYGELLGDGLLGPLPDRASDAVRRMETAGGQLRHLIDGLADLMMQDGEAMLEPAEVDTAATAATLAASARALAGGRGVKLEVVVPENLPVLQIDAGRLTAALDLAVGAAIRASPGASLRLSLSGDGGGLAVSVEGTTLDPARDLPASGDENDVSSGAGLRLLMARRMLRLLGGGARIEGTSPATLVVWVPGSIDATPNQP